MRLNFNGDDFKLLAQKGIKLEEILKQISIFKNGIPPIKLVAPATPQNGAIKILPENQINHFINLYNEIRKRKTIYKFTPASGAATRMFKKLFQFLESEDLEPDDEELRNFFANLSKIAFYEDLQQACKKLYGKTVEELKKENRFKDIVKAILYKDGLNYGNLPKALIKFHKYPDRSRTAMEEHLVEAFGYAIGSDNQMNLHFTVSPEHREQFQKLAEQLLEIYHKEDVKINFSFSEQKPSTDTIAVDMNNQPFRTEDGQLLFRPGGHGALIYNLNEIDADIIFIKNIDNVAPDRLKHYTERYFSALAGYLYTLRNKIDAYLEMLEIGVTDKDLDDIYNFITNVLQIKPKVDLSSKEAKIEFAKKILDRPLRVAGMVKNLGHEGGGPYLVEYEDFISPQIVEKAQIDLNNPDYVKMMKESTHFNPTFMVLWVKDMNGKKYNLLDFVDESASFITIKTYKGKEIKALERPGLWNGAMAYWNTVFVEVPLAVFNPVKTVFDLLKANHLQ